MKSVVLYGLALSLGVFARSAAASTASVENDPSVHARETSDSQLVVGLMRALIVEVQARPGGIAPYQGGEVWIDRARRRIRLVLNPSEVCEAGSPCEASERRLIELELTGASESSCGDRYSGERNALADDGDEIRVSIVDYTRATCRIGYRHAITVNVLTRSFDSIAGRVAEVRDRLWADRWEDFGQTLEPSADGTEELSVIRGD